MYEEKKLIGKFLCFSLFFFNNLFAFEEYIYNSLRTSTKFKTYNTETNLMGIVSKEKWVTLIRTQHTDVRDHCLMIKGQQVEHTNRKSKYAILKFFPLKLKDSCQNSVESPEGEVIQFVREIVMSLSEGKFFLNFHIKRPDDLRTKEYKIEVPLFNQSLKINEFNQFSSQKFMSSSPLSIISGVYAGSARFKSSLVPIRAGEVCSKIDDNCKRVSNSCFACEFGFKMVVASKCENDFQFVCNEMEERTTCGGLNQPACHLGRNLKKEATDKKKDCDASAFNLYCQNSLKVNCVNEEFICF